MQYALRIYAQLYKHARPMYVRLRIVYVGFHKKNIHISSLFFSPVGARHFLCVRVPLLIGPRN